MEQKEQYANNDLPPPYELVQEQLQTKSIPITSETNILHQDPRGKLVFSKFYFVPLFKSFKVNDITFVIIVTFRYE